MTTNEPKFENALQELEGIVSALESKEMPLEESLRLFEKGIQLTHICSAKLAQAEKRINSLLEELQKNNHEIESEN